MCTSYRLYNKKNGLFTYGPCKTCEECRNQRREEYTVRLMHEWETFGYIGSYVTLTYRDKDLPTLLPAGSAILGDWFKGVRPFNDSFLSREDASNFTDKLQKRLKRKYGNSCRYVLAGEYGDDLKRPHFHGIILGLPISDRKLLLETWNKGNVLLKPICKADIRYTLTYIDKQVFGANALYKAYGDFEPPFMHFSKGLGFQWIKDNIDLFNEYGVIEYTDKKTYKLNQYQVDKFRFKRKSDSNIIKYPDVVIEFAKDNNIDDLEQAMKLRSKLKKQELERKDVRYSGGRIDYEKVEKELAFQKMIDNT